MRDWVLGKVIWVADRGFTSAENRRYLRKGGGSYIIGEKLRSGSAEADAALSRQGRYKDVHPLMWVVSGAFTLYFLVPLLQDHLSWI